MAPQQRWKAKTRQLFCFTNKPVSPVSLGIDLRVAAKGSKGLRVGSVRLGWVGLRFKGFRAQ